MTELAIAIAELALLAAQAHQKQVEAAQAAAVDARQKAEADYARLWAQAKKQHARIQALMDNKP